MKPNFSKEYLEYVSVVSLFELRNGVLWVKEFVSKDGRVIKARPASRSVNSAGYILVRASGIQFYEHRVIFILTHNRPIKEGYQIHHKYGNKTDNRIEFLEETSNRENNQNRQKHIDGKLVGASFHKKAGKWRAQIRVNGRLYDLGYYETELEAHLAYMAAYELIEPIPAHIAGQFTPAELRHAVKNILAHNSLKLQERPDALSSMLI